MLKNVDECIKFIEEYYNIRLYFYQKELIKMYWNKENVKSKYDKRQIDKIRYRC